VNENLIESFFLKILWTLEYSLNILPRQDLSLTYVLIFCNIKVYEFVRNLKGGSNTDSGSKRGVQCRYTTILYLAIIIRNLFLKIQKNKYNKNC